MDYGYTDFLQFIPGIDADSSYIVHLYVHIIYLPPVSIVAALASSARNGVLIKGGAYVEAPGRITALAMDKTGTITEGEPEVAGLYPLGGTSETELLTVAAALCGMICVEK